MRIYHSRYDNFGDAIAPHYWSLVRPDIVTGKGSWLLSFGTILHENEIANIDGPAVVFGSAHAWGNTPKLPERFRVIGVRDIGTARRLGIDESKVINDPLYYLATMMQPEPTGPVYYMPHREEMRLLPRGFGNFIGMPVIDPTEDPMTIVDTIRCASGLVTGSLHGAICADAFRVPWAPCFFSSKLLGTRVKWVGWARSTQITNPYLLAALGETRSDNPTEAAPRIVEAAKRLPLLSGEEMHRNILRGLQRALEAL